MRAVCAVPTNAYGECSLLEVAAFDNGHFSAQEGAGPVEDFVSVSMVSAWVGVGGAIVIVGVGRHRGNVQSAGKGEVV